MPTRTRTARMPQVKKKALIAASLMSRRFLLRIARSKPSSSADSMSIRAGPSTHLKFLSLAALYLPSPTVKKPSRSTMAWPSGPTIQARNLAASPLGLPLVAM